MAGLMKMGRRAMRLAEAGQHDEAVSLWEEMNRQKPNHVGLGVGLGAALLAAKRVGEAERWLAKCVQLHPRDKDLAILFGRALAMRRQHKQALGAFYHALSIDPDHLAAHGHLAASLFADRQSAAALPHALKACEGDLSEFHMSTYLCALIDLNECERSLAFVEEVMAHSTLDPIKLRMYRAAALQALGRFDEGLIEAREAARLAPADHGARHHYAAALLAQGELTAEAWANYEGRTGLIEMSKWPAPEYLWTGQDVNGRTIIVHAEQGLGDTLQFIRYVPLLAALGATVVVVVQASLVALLQDTPGAARVIGAGTLPPFDYYCPLLSLPGRFGTTIDSIPPPIPYAIPLPPRSDAPRLQVGIVWAGGDAFIEDRKRSLRPEDVAAFGTIDGVDFHSLQFGADRLPFPEMRDALQGVTDFVGTAFRVAELDLVIAVDTSVAHLAATMGKPVWLLDRFNGCWRWLLDRTDSPWYPSVRIFRQPNADNWTEVVAEVHAALSLAASNYQEAMALALAA